MNQEEMLASIGEPLPTPPTPKSKKVPICLGEYCDANTDDIEDLDENICPDCDEEMIDSCLCCREEICYRCVGVRNRLVFDGDVRTFWMCDFCGTTYRENDTENFDDTFYEIIERKYGLSKEKVVKAFTTLQKKYFDKEEQLKRIQGTIEVLEQKIDELREEYRYILSLPPN